MTTPVTKFIAAPAHRITIFFHQDARPKDRGSAESSSSPSMAQKPPMGRARRLYWVSPFPHLSRAGPMPTANSFTFTPSSLAEAKCPSSWVATRIPKIRTAMMM